LEELERRGIPKEKALSVLENPEQIVEEYGGRKAYQSRIEFKNGKIFLLRVILEGETDPATLVTLYRTSKIEKYWRKS